VSIIRQGRTVEAGTLAELRHLTRTSISVETARPIAGLDEQSGVHDAHVEGTRAKFDVDSHELDHMLRYLTRFEVRTLTSAPPSLEELFMRHYGDELREDGVKARAGVR
jgi:ABC-2 type transport system ATP-binding protein